MARIGLAYSAFAPIVTETPGSPMVYGAPHIFDHPIEANVSYEHTDNPLHGGDAIAENDNSATGGSLSINQTHLTPDDRAGMLGNVKKGVAPNDYYVESALPSPYGGFGYVTSEIENNIKKWYGFWIYKTQLAMSEDNATTKGKTIDWQTPSLKGPIMGVNVDNGDAPDFRKYQVFNTFAEAKAWVNDIAGVDTAAVATPTAAPGAGAVASATPVILASATSGAAIYYTTDGSVPTTGSMLYNTGIKIYGPITIKAIAVKAGMVNSAVLSAAYTIT